MFSAETKSFIRWVRTTDPDGRVTWINWNRVLGVQDNLEEPGCRIEMDNGSVIFSAEIADVLINKATE